MATATPPDMATVSPTALCSSAIVKPSAELSHEPPGRGWQPALSTSPVRLGVTVATCPGSKTGRIQQAAVIFLFGLDVLFRRISRAQ
jgi:hypothetical protein